MHKYNILRLNVSMKYSMAVHNIDCFQQISNNKWCTLLGESLSSSDKIIELPIAAELHDCIETFLITKETIVMNDVGMI